MLKMTNDKRNLLLPAVNAYFDKCVAAMSLLFNDLTSPNASIAYGAGLDDTEKILFKSAQYLTEVDKLNSQSFGDPISQDEAMKRMKDRIERVNGSPIKYNLKEMLKRINNYQAF